LLSAASNVPDIVTTNKHLSKVASKGIVDIFIGFRTASQTGTWFGEGAASNASFRNGAHLKVHVRVNGCPETLVFHAPLELYDNMHTFPTRSARRGLRVKLAAQRKVGGAGNES